MASVDVAAPKASLSNIFSILSDEDCVKMLQMIFEHRQPRIGDFGTRKRYYERMARLKKAHLITKKKNIGYQIKKEPGHELTDLGSILYESLLTLKHAKNLLWNLKAIDALDEEVPIEERKKLTEALIPDEAIRKILVEKY